MSVASICDVCGDEAISRCDGCGAAVCGDHYDPSTGFCDECKMGRKMED